MDCDLEDGYATGVAVPEQTAKQMLSDAGFGQIDLRRVERDFFHSFYFCRR